MKIVGTLILILGIANLTLILFQLSSGMRWVKTSFQIHRKTGMLLLASATLHALLALIVD